jgi:GNAT superfamily N-acetyltransferase
LNGDGFLALDSVEDLPVTIRPASPADAGRLAVLCGQLGYPASVEEIRQRFDPVARDEQHVVYVAQSPDGQVIGWIHAYLRPLLEEDLQAEIGGLVIDEAWRNYGIGQRLLQQAEQWAQEQGCWAVHVRSNVIRERAHRFYRRLGYSSVKTQLSFRKVLKSGRS